MTGDSQIACSGASNTNVLAFLRVIRQGESRQDDAAFGMLVYGGHFTDFSDHPRQHFDRVTHRLVVDWRQAPPNSTSSAAGAFQITETTWNDFCHATGYAGPFDQDGQTQCAVWLMNGAKALVALFAGDFDSAVKLCRSTWTSLPGAAESHSNWTLAKARELYVKYGGAFGVQSLESTPAPPQPIPPTQPIVAERKSMPAPLLLALAPMLADLIPQIAKLFSSGSEVATRNVAAVEAVASTVVKATASANVQEAIEKMQADPILTTAVQQAVVTDPVVMGLLEVGGGIAVARQANLAIQVAEKPFWFNPAIWISLVLVAMPFMLLSDVFFFHPSSYDGPMRTQVVTAVLGIVLMVGGYWLGSSAGSQRKDDRAASSGQPT